MPKTHVISQEAMVALDECIGHYRACLMSVSTACFGGKYCALCVMYREATSSCGTCPIKVDAGGCRATCYADIAEGHVNHKTVGAMLDYLLGLKSRCSVKETHPPVADDVDAWWALINAPLTALRGPCVVAIFHGSERMADKTLAARAALTGVHAENYRCVQCAPPVVKLRGGKKA